MSHFDFWVPSFGTHLFQLRRRWSPKGGKKRWGYVGGGFVGACFGHTAISGSEQNADLRASERFFFFGVCVCGCGFVQMMSWPWYVLL